MEPSEEDEGEEADTGFCQKWQWMIMVQRVMEVTGYDIDGVMAMPAIAWLNMFCFAIDKTRYEREQNEKALRKGGRQ